MKTKVYAILLMSTAPGQNLRADVHRVNPRAAGGESGRGYKTLSPSTLTRLARVMAPAHSLRPHLIAHENSLGWRLVSAEYPAKLMLMRRKAIREDAL